MDILTTEIRILSKELAFNTPISSDKYLIGYDSRIPSNGLELSTPPGLES